MASEQGRLRLLTLKGEGSSSPVALDLPCVDGLVSGCRDPVTESIKPRVG